MAENKSDIIAAGKLKGFRIQKISYIKGEKFKNVGIQSRANR